MKSKTLYSLEKFANDKNWYAIGPAFEHVTKEYARGAMSMAVSFYGSAIIHWRIVESNNRDNIVEEMTSGSKLNLN